jgi:hypothetical protein
MGLVRVSSLDDGPLLLVLGCHVVGKVGNRAEGEDSVLEEERQGGVEDRAL